MAFLALPIMNALTVSKQAYFYTINFALTKFEANQAGREERQAHLTQNLTLPGMCVSGLDQHTLPEKISYQIKVYSQMVDA